MTKGISGLQISAVFAPLLALVIGLAIWLKAEDSNEVSSRLRLIAMMVDEASDLDTAYRRQFDGRGVAIRNDWWQKHGALQQLLATVKVSDPADEVVFGKMTRILDRIKAIFSRLTKPGTTLSDAERIECERELKGLSRDLLSETVRLAEVRHNAVVSSTQSTDALILIFSAIIAVLMAVAAYKHVRDEIGRREEIARELDQSNIMLSDAFVKLHRAEQGIHQERLRALEDTAQVVGGEVESHLDPIRRVSDTFLKHPELAGDPATIRAGMATIDTSVHKASRALERLRVFVGGSQSGPPGQIEARALVEDAINLNRSRLSRATDGGAPIRIEKEFFNVWPFEGYEVDLREALGNLIQNAIEAMPQGGTLAIRTNCEGDEITIAITDSGIGMTEEARHHCCDPFFSTKGPASAGMGLTVVTATVRRHKGHLEIRSRVGEGTTVTMRLPRKAPIAQGVAASVPDPAGRLDILVVDDEEWAKRFLQEILTRDGHRVVCAGNGHEGLDKFRAGHFDLVITDRSMPGMGGEELAALVKKAAPGTQVILLTGFGEMIRGAGVSTGPVDIVLSKPVTIESLRSGITEATARRAQPGRQFHARG